MRTRLWGPAVGLLLVGSACDFAPPGPLDEASLEASFQGANAALLDFDDGGQRRDERGFRLYRFTVDSVDVPQIDQRSGTFYVCEQETCLVDGFDVPESTAELQIAIGGDGRWVCPLSPDGGGDWQGRCVVGSVTYDPVFIGPDLDSVELL